MRRSLSRRDFLKSAMGMPAWVMAPTVPDHYLPRLTVLAPEGQEPRANVMVCIFLRGGMDGLNVVIPHGDAEYYRQRPTLAIAEPDGGKDSTGIDLDGFFGLHPALRSLKDVWDDRALAVVHATGSPDPTRSHFDAMDYMERGTPGEKEIATGWLARHLSMAADRNGSPFRAVGFGTLLHSSLRGFVPAVALQSITDFHLSGDFKDHELQQFQNSILEMYTLDQTLGPRADATLDTVQLLNRVISGNYLPSNNAQYPDSSFGQSLKQVAQLIKGEIGLEVATIDLGGWDTHVNQGALQGDMPSLLADFGASLAAFHHDLGDAMKHVTVVAMSEFGRRVKENGGGGTDHGYGNMMFAMGKLIRGGRVYGRWPGLAPEALVDAGDLAITTDFRSVLGELVSKHLLNPSLDQVFPNFTGLQPLGLADDIS